MGSKIKWFLLAAVAAFAVYAAAHVYMLDLGKRSFARLGCESCHLSGGGPNLAHILPQYDEKTVEDFIKDPDEVYHRLGRKPLNPGFSVMHKVKTTPLEVTAMAKYLKSW